MASEAQMEANRGNAQSSTGPRSAEGRAASAQNAVTHGLFSQQTVLDGEDSARFEALLERLREEYAPQDLQEELLLERAACAAWRLQRVLRIEREMMEQRLWQLRDQEAADPAAEPATLGAGVSGWFEDATLERLGRYAGRIERTLERTVGELSAAERRRQASRRANGISRQMFPDLGDEDPA
jgi:hypothetical protein